MITRYTQVCVCRILHLSADLFQESKREWAADCRSFLELIRNTRGDNDIIYDYFCSARTCKKRIFLVVGSALYVWFVFSFYSNWNNSRKRCCFLWKLWKMFFPSEYELSWYLKRKLIKYINLLELVPNIWYHVNITSVGPLFNLVI